MFFCMILLGNDYATKAVGPRQRIHPTGIAVNFNNSPP